jgi:hypothetical protein
MSESPYPELRRRALPWNGAEYFSRGRRVWAYGSLWEYKRWLLGLVLVLGGGWLVGARLIGYQRLYQSAPVSRAHTPYQDDCRRCHVDWMQTGRRLHPANADLRTVPDSACQQCHATPLPDQYWPGNLASLAAPAAGLPAPVHSDQQPDDLIPACAACHREHQGKPTLKAVPDDSCTTCHADLRRKDKTVPRCAASVTRFAPGAHPDFRYPPDGAMLAFNHHRHVTLDIVDTNRQPIKLEDCRTCHQPNLAEGGRHMLPIRYDLHCKQCHPLTVPVAVEVANPSGQAGLEAALKQLRSQPLRHGVPPVDVREELRARNTQFVKAQPEVLAFSGGAPARPLPGDRGSRPVSASAGAWVQSQTRLAERHLFGSPSGCRLCHVPAAPTRTDGLPVYAPTNLRRSWWYSHSTFSHRSHPQSCTDCHGDARTSVKTADVLLPALAGCVECHSAPAGAANRAGSDCVSCHRYHDRGQEHLWRRFR